MLIPEAEGKTPADLLEEVKPVLQGAYAVRQLRSGDVEVMVPDRKAKDQALNQQETEGCKVLRHDYPVEVLGVPLCLGIQNRKSTENDDIIRDIQDVHLTNKRIIPNLAINKIRWLHDDKRRRRES